MLKLKLLLLLVISTTAFSQTPAVEWQTTYGSGFSAQEAYDVVKTSDGGYAIVGMAYENGGDVTGNHGVADYWVVKINSLGTLQWQKSLGGSSADYGSSIKQTSDLGFIVVGSSESNDGDVTGNHGAKDYWVIKLNSTGNILWSKSFGGTNDDIANSVYQTNDGGYIVGGYSNSNNGDVTGNHGGYDYWVIKIDSNGFIQWQKSYGGTGDEGTSNTGSSYRPFSSISQTSNNGFVFTISTTSNNGDVIGNHGANDYLIINADVNGTILWQKCFGGSLDDNPHSVTQTNDGGFIIAGTTFSNDGNIQGFYDYADYWVVKTDANGMLLWQKCYGGLSNDRAYCIRQTIDGGYILAGFTYSANGDVTLPSSNNINDPSFSEGWIVKINSNGFIEWNRIVDYPTPNNAFSISQTSDGGYIAVGLTLSGGFFLVKLQNTTSLIDLDDSGSKIYPNPANNYINIKANRDSKIHSFSITNCLGKQILSGSNINESNAIDLTEISSGIYFIDLFDENNSRIKTEKFIKN